MRYALFENKSTNHAYFDRLRKSDTIENVYGIWTNALVYKLINNGLPATVLKIIHTLNEKRNINLLIFAGEIDIRFHCAKQNAISGEELALGYIKIAKALKTDLNLLSLTIVMPIPPNKYFSNGTKINGSFHDRLFHYNSFRQTLLKYRISDIEIMEFPSISEGKEGLCRTFLSDDLVHLNELGLGIVRKAIKKKIRYSSRLLKTDKNRVFIRNN